VGRAAQSAFACTEHGVAMVSSALRSERATMANIAIMRAFVGLREALARHAALVRKLDALGAKFDGQSRVVFDAIRGLVNPRKRTRKQIGFVAARPQRLDGIETRRLKRP
jgi:hypothetical protein